MVTCITYRNPVVLARMAADVDRISGGRLVLGLGAGDYDWEHEQMGIPWPTLRARQAMLGEGIGVLRALWGDATAQPPREHFAVSAPPLQPGPAQQPRIPILIAGGGERVTLRQVARYADASNFGEHAWTGGVAGGAAVQRRLGVLQQHCESLGRPFDSVLRTHTTFPLVLTAHHGDIDEKLERYLPPRLRAATATSLVARTPDDAIEYYARLLQSGLRYFVAFTVDLETVELLAREVIPELRRLSGAAQPQATNFD